MYKINQFTNDAKQRHQINIPDNSILTLQVQFVQMQLGWFIEELTYGDLTINQMRIHCSPNMLHQFRNKLPFGLACFSKGDREPSLQNDLITPDINLYILTAAECEQYYEYLNG